MQINKTDLKGLFIFIDVAVNSIIKNPKLVLLTCLLPVLVTKESRVLEKRVNETQVSKTVFDHELSSCLSV